jgi:hypothetical protein
MTTSQTAKPTCRCGSTLALLGSSKTIWVDEHIDWLCSDGKPHAPLPVCPPSSVVDMIICWQQVGAGDLVLHEGRMDLAEKVEPQVLGDVIVTFGDGRRIYAHGETLTAVRRYDTAEDSR